MGTKIVVGSPGIVADTSYEVINMAHQNFTLKIFAYILYLDPGPQLKVCNRKNRLTENYFLISQPKTYVVGTHKNRLNETVLLSTQNTCLYYWVIKNSQFCDYFLTHQIKMCFGY